LTHISASEASDIVNGCAEQLEAVAEMLSDLNGRLTYIVDTYEWSSFTPDERIMLKQFHHGCKHAQIALRKPHG